MKCPKCGYTSFPYLESCRKCGQGLTDQRAAMGPYALPLDPPDLLLAYQADQGEVTRAMLMPSMSASGIDLDQQDEIEGGTEEIETIGGAPEVTSIELGTEQLISPDPVAPTTVDLYKLGDLTLALEGDSDIGDESPEAVPPSSASPEAKQVYDLDLDEDLDGMTLGFAVDESIPDARADEITEYPLKIEDNLDLEIDELELSADDEAAGEDDDDR